MSTGSSHFREVHKLWHEDASCVQEAQEGRTNGIIILSAKSDEKGKVNMNMSNGQKLGGASTGKEEYDNMAAEKLRKSGMKNGKEHFNIQRCTPVAVVEVPKEIKEPTDYHQVELSSRASGKRD